jgi:acylphosphatase
LIAHIDSKRLHAIVEGSVQGVGFRGFVLENAIRLDLKGWVRNQWNGNVEVMAEGSHNSLESLLELLRQGPHMSQVTNVQVEWQENKNEFSSFFVAKTQ